MKFIKNWCFLTLCFGMCLSWFSCTSDVCISSYKYNFETTDNLTDAVVGVNEKIKLNVFFPDRIFTDTVNFDNTSRFPFKVALYLKSISDTTMLLEDQNNAWPNFTSSITNGFSVDSNFAVGPSIDLSQSRAFLADRYNDTMRAVQIELQTAVRDTYMLYWVQANNDDERLDRGTITLDTCTNVVNFTLKNTAENHDSILTSILQSDLELKRNLRASAAFIVQ